MRDGHIMLKGFEQGRGRETEVSREGKY